MPSWHVDTTRRAFIHTQQVMTRFLACQSAAVRKVLASLVSLPFPLLPSLAPHMHLSIK